MSDLVVVESADEDVLTAVPSVNPPKHPLMCSVLIQLYVDPNNHNDIDMRMSHYNMSWNNLQSTLMLALEGVAQSIQEAQAKDRSVKMYAANGTEIQTAKPIFDAVIPSATEPVSLKLDD